MMEETRAANADLQQPQISDVLPNTCMLVSDSNEVSNQMDSKQLLYDTLVELAQDNLFKKYLDMSKYLTRNQYEVYRDMLNDKYNALSELKSALERQVLNNGTMVNYKPKLRVAEGQVILVEANKIPPGKSPEDYVQEQWDITSEYKLLPIPDCMLRGMLDTKDARIGSGNQLVAQKQGNLEVNLKNENMPPHMHHSSVTTGIGFTTMTKDNNSSTYFVKGNTAYDMFYNDSMDVGLSKNELDGTIDTFKVVATGKDEGSESTGTMMSHDNMPKYQAFYGFVVQKVTV